MYPLLSTRPKFRLVAGFLALALAIPPAYFGRPSQPALCTGADRPVAQPLNDLGASAYVRMDGQVTEFTGGLYPGGSNSRPDAHEAAGQALAAMIVPLGTDGQPDPAEGRIALVSLGMSNTQMEFQRFMDRVHRDLEVNPQVVLINGALGGRTADRWVDPAAPTYDEVDRRLAEGGLTPAQVQVMWIKQTLTRGGAFPEKALELQADLQAIVRNLAARYPNLKLVFLSSRTRSFTYDRGLSPEPTAFETGFAVKWLIEAQIDGDPDLNYDPAHGPVVAPYLSWGPYLWIDGENPRSDGMIWTSQALAQDCTHPSAEGTALVADMLRAFFLGDSLTARWFGVSIAAPTPAPRAANTRAPTPSPAPPASPTPQPMATVGPTTGPTVEAPTGDAAGLTSLIVGAAVLIAAAGGLTAIRRSTTRPRRRDGEGPLFRAASRTPRWTRSMPESQERTEADDRTMTRLVSTSTKKWASVTLREAGWAPLLVLLVYVLAAGVFDLFAVFPRLDFPMHFAGGLAVAYFISRGLQAGWTLWDRPAAGARAESAIVLLLTLAVALLWELAEFSSDSLFGTREQLGMDDTVRDLLAGMLGALIFVALPNVYSRQNP